MSIKEEIQELLHLLKYTESQEVYKFEDDEKEMEFISVSKIDVKLERASSIKLLSYILMKLEQERKGELSKAKI